MAYFLEHCRGHTLEADTNTKEINLEQTTENVKDEHSDLQCCEH